MGFERRARRGREGTVVCARALWLRLGVRVLEISPRWKERSLWPGFVAFVSLDSKVLEIDLEFVLRVYVFVV